MAERSAVPPLEEAEQRVWTAYKLWATDMERAAGDWEFWLHWMHRAELNAHTYFLTIARRFPTREEFTRQFIHELLIQANAKCQQRGHRLSWDPEQGFIFHHAAGTRIQLEGPVAEPHPYAYLREETDQDG